MKMAALGTAIFCLGACASLGAGKLRVGEADVGEVEARWGKPALRWQEPDGSQRLVYPRGPAGYRTEMVHVAPDGRLAGIENVLVTEQFARIRPGMSQEEVVRVLGPPYPAWTVYFKARDELVWEWRYCDDWAEPARFNVFFDGASGKVRSTGSLTESQRFGGRWRQWCGR